MSSSSDRQPLLPTHSQSLKPHMNHSSSSRLSTTRISFPSSTTSALDSPDVDDDQTLVSTSTSPKKGKHRAWSGSPLTSGEGQRNPGLPKLSRECLISEIKCYGSYMLPPLLIFGVLAIGLCLLIYGIKRGWFR
ncbi:hypothetical protein I302_102189 [Kwoniella bestiolae CBS 10118]|uniref:Uncharacterized protein n=1 Tax=Kwoniella bestiolae CBS 10118 TaxID=1296100 RepID=A0A1B9GEC2_9TREE|nr:hypothetical protein I302_00876 [Kwoniella bestiolae CBS 10118]OCF29374.1 hypothetical protein I302_00876 [Kwoniella bestiolae CBS 10118]